MELDEHEQRVVDIVRDVGWMVLKVNPNEGDLHPRWFAYTIGLSVSFGWPELICLGPPPDVTVRLINNSVHELRSKGVTPSPGLELNEVLEGYPTRLEAFPKKFFLNHLGWAMWFADYRGLKPQQFGCLQLLYPDKDGRFPADPACHTEVRRDQTPISNERLS